MSDEPRRPRRSVDQVPGHVLGPDGIWRPARAATGEGAPPGPGPGSPEPGADRPRSRRELRDASAPAQLPSPGAVPQLEPDPPQPSGRSVDAGPLGLAPRPTAGPPPSAPPAGTPRGPGRSQPSDPRHRPGAVHPRQEPPPQRRPLPVAPPPPPPAPPVHPPTHGSWTPAPDAQALPPVVPQPPSYAGVHAWARDGVTPPAARTWTAEPQAPASPLPASGPPGGAAPGRRVSSRPRTPAEQLPPAGPPRREPVASAPADAALAPAAPAQAARAPSPASPASPAPPLSAPRPAWPGPDVHPSPTWRPHERRYRVPVWRRGWVFALEAAAVMVLVGAISKATEGAPDPGWSLPVDGSPVATSPAPPGGGGDDLAGPYDTQFGRFDPVTVEGSGDDVVPVPPGGSAGLVVASYGGGGTFRVQPLDASGAKAGRPLVSSSGAYSGTTAYGLRSARPDALRVSATGHWVVTLVPVSGAAHVGGGGAALSGTGDTVVLYDGPQGHLAYIHDDTSAFSVVQYGGKEPLTLVDGEGAMSDTAPIDTGPSVVVVRTTGTWRLAQL